VHPVVCLVVVLCVRRYALEEARRAVSGRVIWTGG